MALRDRDQTNLDNDEKISSNTNAMVDNAGTQTVGSIPEERMKAAALHADAEALLRSLRNVITPLACSANEPESKHDANEDALGPNGEQFIIALQKFMSSYLRSQQGPPGGIEIEVNERKAEISSPHNDYDDFYDSYPGPEPIPNDGIAMNIPLHSDHNIFQAVDISNMEPTHNLITMPEPEGSQDQESIEPIDESLTLVDSSSPVISLIHDRDSGDIRDTLEQKWSRFLDKVLDALREHVFNVMPIRLLYLQPHASRLQITLIERGDIYAYIASNLKTSFDVAKVSGELAHLEGFLSEQEAERTAIAQMIHDCSRYAILSHTWLRGTSNELTYGDWKAGESDTGQPGYQKLVNFCKTAWENHGVVFGWMDTVCINKESSAELDESIRSMYNWYRGAHICITYLADTVTLSDMSDDNWFTRGWTLQELLAPWHIKFYNMHWNKLVESSNNDKTDPIILTQIEQATTITAFELTRPIIGLPISRRMQMAARRQVTREEDTAYALMGIFDVSMATAYGEGAVRAFFRLLQEILNSSDFVVDVFNWAGPDSSRISSLLPPTPQHYLHRSLHLEVVRRPIEPFMLTHLGLRVTIVLMPAISIQNPTLRYDPIGDYHAVADISPLTDYLAVADDMMVGGNCSVLDARISKGDGWQEEQNRYQLTFGILNVGGGDNQTISVPKHCLAVGLQHFMGNHFKIPTAMPIVFTLDKKGGSDGGESTNYSTHNEFYHIERRALASHGMKLVTLYL